MAQSVSLAGRLDRRFHISARNSTIGTEILGGTTTFMSMVYIIPVSANMYAAAHVDSVLASIAIAFVTCVISILMGVAANIPIALSTGMGLNAFAVFTICLGMGYSYNLVMLCTLIEGAIFLALSLTGLRSGLAKAMPHNLKMMIGAGIGGFLVYIGCQNAHLIVGDASTLTTMVNFRTNFSTQGICAILAVIGVVVAATLTVRHSKPAIIIGIAVAWVLGMICQALGIYVPDVDAGYYSLYPSLHFPAISSLGGMFISTQDIGALNGEMILNIIIITGTMFYSDFFDTLGTCMTCIEKIKAQMKEEINDLRRAQAAQGKAMEAELADLSSEKTTKRALTVDAIGTIFGSLFRCTTITSFVESGAGIESGARTGLSAIVTGLWFLVAIFAASIFTAIPGFATGPALIMVGCSMLISAFQQIEWSKIGEKYHEIIAGALCVLFTILTYNIANGMAVGIISYVAISLFTGRRREVSPMFSVLSVLLIVKFIFL